MLQIKTTTIHHKIQKTDQNLLPSNKDLVIKILEFVLLESKTVHMPNPEIDKNLLWRWYKLHYASHKYNYNIVHISII